jgi:hypothetical protein
VCTGGDQCAAGNCVAGPKVTCDDGNPCTDDSCDAQKGCVAANNSAGCDDANGCTSQDKCSAGKCLGSVNCSANAACQPGPQAVSCVCNPGFSGDGFTCTSPLGTSSNPGASCAAILAANSSAETKVYWLDPDGSSGPVAAFEALCDMTTAGGGWTLVIKVSGSSTVLSYDAALWTNTATLNAASTGSEVAEAKLSSFNTLPFKDVLVRMVDGAPRNLTLNFAAQTSMRAMMAGSYVPTAKGRDAWKGLMASGSLQPYCNLEGVNAVCNGETRVRIGIVANQENDCGSCDSRIGFGGAGVNCGQDGSNSCGNEATCGPDNGDRHTKAFGYIFVR